MPRRVEPPAAEHEAVCDNDGERFFVDYLLRHLPEEWEVYVQPPLNGRRPDVIVLNPQVGIGVFEVKDWNLALYRTEGERIVGTSQQGCFPAENPCYQVQMYRKQVLEVLAPSLSIAVARNPAALACIQVGVIFTHAQAMTEQARGLLYPHLSAEERRYIAVVGRNTVNDHPNPQSIGVFRGIRPAVLSGTSPPVQPARADRRCSPPHRTAGETRLWRSLSALSSILTFLRFFQAV